MPERDDVTNVPAETAQTESAESEEDRRFVAKYEVHPTLRAARALDRMAFGTNSDRLNDLCNELHEHVLLAKAGNNGRGLTMLNGQAHTLEAIFYHLAEQAIKWGCYGEELAMYLKPAFRAQAQCRATIQTMANLTNPRPVSVVQTNIAENIQVNNAQTEKVLSKLSSESRGENELLPNTGTPTTAGGTNPQLEAVGAVNGAANNTGEGQSSEEQLQRRS